MKNSTGGRNSKCKFVRGTTAKNFLMARDTTYKEFDHVMSVQKKLPRGEALKKRILRSVSDLPPMPQAVFKVREIMGNPNSSFKELADIPETDQAIATRVLKIANSAYGMSGKVSSIQHASIVLGHKTMGELMTIRPENFWTFKKMT